MAAMNLNLEQFHKTVVENKGTALVEFWAPWCVYCRRIGPAYDKIAQQYQEALSVAKVNIDESRALPSRSGLSWFPPWFCTRTARQWGPLWPRNPKPPLRRF